MYVAKEAFLYNTAFTIFMFINIPVSFNYSQSDNFGD